MFRRDSGNRWWTLKCYFSKNRLLGCNINTLSLTHLSLQHYPSGLLSCYRRQSLIKEHFCASLISHNEFTRGADLSFFPPFSSFLFLQSLTATKQRSRSSVLALVSFSLSEMRDWFFDPFFGWGRTLNLPECLSRCGLGSCVGMCKMSSNGFCIASLKPLSDSTEGRTKTTHTHTFSFSYRSHLLFLSATNTENIWYNYHLAN